MDDTVLIIGAGVTGLCLAINLTQQGIPVRIIDKKPARDSFDKASGLHSRALEIFSHMGVADNMLIRGQTTHTIDVYPNQKEPLALSYQTQNNAHPYYLIINQDDIESCLEQSLLALGVVVEWGVECLHISSQDEHVICSLKRANNRLEKMIVPYLVACDGMHSFVRQSLELEYQGTTHPNYWLFADCKPSWHVPQHHLALFDTSIGTAVYMPLAQDYGRFMLQTKLSVKIHHPPSPGTTDFKALLAQYQLPIEKIDEYRWLAYVKLNQRSIQHYQVNRIFFCGESAHIDIPLLGQGLSHCIEDAYNLSWKLALVIKQLAKSDLLVSYHQERYAAYQLTQQRNARFMKLLNIRAPFLQPIKSKLTHLLLKKSERKLRIVQHLSQAKTAYPQSPINKRVWKVKNPQFTLEKPLQVGDCVPNQVLTTRAKQQQPLYSLVNRYGFTVLLFTGLLDVFKTETLQALLDVTQAYPGLFKLLLVQSSTCSADIPAKSTLIPDQKHDLHELFGAYYPSLFVVRPDHYISLQCCPVKVDIFQAWIAQTLAADLAVEQAVV